MLHNSKKNPSNLGFFFIENIYCFDIFKRNNIIMAKTGETKTVVEKTQQPFEEEYKDLSGKSLK